MLTDPIPEVGSWSLLAPPPGENDEKIEVGVVELHPTIDRVAYTTRARKGKSEDAGSSRIIIQTFNVNLKDGGNEVVASLSFRELVKRINEFRTNSNSSDDYAHVSHSQEILQSLSTKAPSNVPFTIEMLGAVQNLAFLSRDAICTQVPPGYVREEPSMMQRLMIGFRRCVVIVSFFHLEDPKVGSCARGVEVIGYIGPDNLVEYEPSDKARTRQPSSFPIPISENIVAYGCYDGGIRFYDILLRKQVKSALGPNGRGNPIVKLINANRNESNYLPSLENRNTKKARRQIRPRIVSVAPSGVAAYLWELDLSIDLDSGEILKFHIPPPLVCFNGLVAAVSCKGLPVKYPPTLSPTSISSLSPSSSWEQTDEVNSQFEVSYDPHLNVLCWVFSPDCVGSSLKPRASREERLNMSGVMVVWDLGVMPQPEYPPPILPPHCVQQLPRTEDGRVTADMTVPVILSDPYLITIYITSSNELMATVANLSKRGESIQIGSRVSELADLSVYSCCAVAATSRIHTHLILVGTQYGILFATISAGSDEQLFNIQDEQMNQFSPRSPVRKISEDSNEIVSEIECCNKEQEFQGHDLRGVQSFETDLGTASSKVKALEAEVETLQENLDRANAQLEDEILNNQAITLILAATEGRATELDEEVDSRTCKLVALQEECNMLRNQIDKISESSEKASETLGEITLALGTSSDNLQKDPPDAKEAEDSLRAYITLLEETLSAKDNDLEVARRHAEGYTMRQDEVVVKQQSDQQLTIDSLVDLLERQRIDHANITMAHHDEVRRLKEEMSTLQAKHHASMAEMKDKVASSTELILALTVELQNTRNEICAYRHKQKDQS